MTWFEELIGAPEDLHALANIEIFNGILKSNINFNGYAVGDLRTPSLKELRSQVIDYINNETLVPYPNHIEEVVDDVKNLYTDPNNTNAMFQVASQFNLLEMANPSLTPDDGVSIYEHDKTQGPISAICCGAGTIYRNYFIQGKEHQLNCLSGIEYLLKNRINNYWTMQNGYVMFNKEKLPQLNEHIEKIGREQLKNELKVGVQRDTQVTINGAAHLVTQVFCSAIPVAYNSKQSMWAEVDPIYEPLSSLILEAAYEATICESIIHNIMNNNVEPLYLTLLGGGAFGNEKEWILNAIQKAIYPNCGLDIKIVSYGQSDHDVQKLIEQL